MASEREVGLEWQCGWCWRVLLRYLRCNKIQIFIAIPYVDTFIECTAAGWNSLGHVLLSINIEGLLLVPVLLLRIRSSVDTPLRIICSRINDIDGFIEYQVEISL